MSVDQTGGISFAESYSDRLEMLDRLESYWQSLRHVKRIATRTSLDPSKIDDTLPYAFVAQRVAPGVARFRVAGQRVNDLIKMDARGMPISALFDASAHAQIRDWTEKVFDQPAIVQVSLVSKTGLLSPEVRAEILMLPMTDAAGSCTRLLGALVAETQAGLRPRRFLIDDAAVPRLVPLGPQLVTTTAQHIGQKKRAERSVARPDLRIVVNNG